MSDEKEGLLGQKSKGPDWARFGLGGQDNVSASGQHPVDNNLPSEGGGKGILRARQTSGGSVNDDVSHLEQGANPNELYREDLEDSKHKPWYKSNFLITEPVLFGTWDGVFTSCMINIFGVVIFLRTGWMVGNAGIGLSMLMIFMTIAVAVIAVLSAIGVCERCRVESGGVYFLLSHVLGAKLGASLGILYCFGQAVACSLYTMGFGESIKDLLKQDNEWVAKGIAVGLVLVLLSINLAGVKWVIRLQLILLMVLLIAVLDFVVGSFVHTDTAHNVTGYSTENIHDNSGPDFLDEQTFFTVFGVFFPTATGVFAGINMSGDLRDPRKNIPIGTLSAVGVSTTLYLVFALVLGATCTREALQTDCMIAAKVAWLGPLLLTGLYVSSMSAALAGLTGSPRVLQAIAISTKLPLMGYLTRTWGPNKVPVFSLLTITGITLCFILIGNVNVLGPIVTMPFMLTYASVDYAYFSLAMSFDLNESRAERLDKGTTVYQAIGAVDPSDGAADQLSPKKKPLSGSNDLDKLFPERLEHKRAAEEQGLLKRTSPTSPTAPEHQEKPQSAPEITRQPRSCYSVFCNRWLSLIGALFSVLIAFSIKWAYALAAICLVLALYIYIGQANPGVFPGIAQFSFIQWVRTGIRNCCRRGPAPSEEIVVGPGPPSAAVEEALLTEDNEDYAERGKFHQSQLVKGQNIMPDDL